MPAIHRFEIPASKFERVKTFYETFLNTQIYSQDLRETMGSIVGMLYGGIGVGGALVHNPESGYLPSREGTLVYLNVSGDLDYVLGRVGAAGGEALLPKTALGEDAGGGYVAWVLDTEGNKVGLFSQE